MRGVCGTAAIYKDWPVACIPNSVVAVKEAG